MPVDFIDLHQLNKELDGCTRNSVVHGCQKSRSVIWFCVAHDSILTFYKALRVTALFFYRKSDFFGNKKLCE